MSELQPREIEAEEAILSTILNDPQSIDEITEHLDPEDFYRSKHQKVFLAIFSLLGDSLPVTLTSITSRMRERDDLGEDGARAVSKLMDNPVSGCIEFDCDLIKKAAAKRRAICEVNNLFHEIKDETDLAKIEKSISERFSLIQAVASVQSKKHRFEFVHNSDLLGALEPITYQIHGIMTDRSFYYNFGDSGSFKTFVELDRLLCIASGLPYHGHSVKQGTVFYICGEGQQGIGRRIAGWHIAHKTKAEDIPFFVAKVPTQLMDPSAVLDVRKAVDALAKQYGPPAVVHIDTLARNFGEGDENATKDMNRVIANMDAAFKNDFCCGVTHHTGHANKDRARGSYALHGAADIAYKVGLQDDRIMVECMKMKDAPPALPMIFERREILLRIGDANDKTYVLDLVAEGDDAVQLAKSSGPAHVTDAMNHALALLKSLQGKDGSVRFKAWRTQALKNSIYTRSDNFNTAADRMEKKGLIQFDAMRANVCLVEGDLQEFSGGFEGS